MTGHKAITANDLIMLVKAGSRPTGALQKQTVHGLCKYSYVPNRTNKNKKNMAQKSIYFCARITGMGSNNEYLAYVMLFLIHVIFFEQCFYLDRESG